MERSLYYLRLFPGTEERYDAVHLEVPGAVARGMTDAGMSNVSGWRRGTDVWWYAETEPDRDTAFSRVGKGVVNQRWGHQFRDVIAEIEAPGGGLMWYEEIFHTDAPAPSGPSERGLFSLVIDTHKADRYDELHADPWPEMLQAITEAGYRDYTGFRRGAHVVYHGHHYPDLQTVIDRVNATDVAARWGAELKDVITTFTGADGRNHTATEVYHQD
jgi:L-rhamnose mutarotase